MALASVAIKKLGLHKLLLINSVELSVAIGQHVPLLDALTPEEVIVHGWKQDPPKALSDVLESVLGALFVDADYNYDKVAPIVEAVLADLLAVLRPDLPKDPVTEFMIWAAKSGCRCVSFSCVSSLSCSPSSQRSRVLCLCAGNRRAGRSSAGGTAWPSSSTG